MRSALGLLCALFAFAACAQSGGLNEAQLARYHGLNAELRCLICQNRSIAESDAPLAKDLRAIVARQIVAGRSDDEIKQYLVDRYGEWVLYDPPFDWNTWLLWLGPFGLLLIGLIIVAMVMRRRTATPATSRPVDRERLARVLEAYESGDYSAGDKDRT